MNIVVIIFVAGLAGIALAGGYALRRGMARVRRECTERMEGAEERLKQLEHAVARHEVEIEELGIQVETRAYWED